MTKTTLEFEPCVFSDRPGTDVPGRWKDSDRVRWHNGLPKKIGGWQPLQLAAGGDTTFRGICRRLHDWTDLIGQEWIAIATHKRLHVLTNGALSNITPVRATANLTNPFSTDSTGAFDPTGGNDARYFRVQDVAHGADVGDIVVITGASAIGGITPAGSYEVREIVDADNYTLRHSSAATSTVSGGGGTPTVVYELAAGDEAAAVGTGYGLGTYGTGTYGTPRTAASKILPPRTWSLENWGEDLLASPLAGGIYLWDKSVGVGTPAALITQAPHMVNVMVLSPEDRHLIALGCSDPGGTANYDPLLVRWCSQENYTDWTPTEDNTAGLRRLDGGSYIIAALRTSYGILIWTDKTLHIMQFIGPPNTFSIRQIAGNISIMGPNAVIDAQGVAFWMGRQGFGLFDGAVKELVCEIRDKVFENTQLEQGYQVYASLNDDFSEIRWDYPSAVTEQNSLYAVYNRAHNGWYGGTMQRSAMHDEVNMFSGKPYGTDTAGVGISDDNVSTFFIHETGVDDGPNPMNEFMESWDMHFPGANEVIHVTAVYPDFHNLVGNVSFTFSARKRPQQPIPTVKVVSGIASNTERKPVRIRGTQISWKVSSSALGVDWHMGNPEFDWQLDGEAK
jgi:hypothetical protein